MWKNLIYFHLESEEFDTFSDFHFTLNTFITCTSLKSIFFKFIAASFYQCDVQVIENKPSSKEKESLKPK